MKERWRILASLCKEINAEVVAEIGVSRGINAAYWLELCPDICRMYLVDNNNSVFDTGLFEGRQDKITYISKSSTEAAKHIQNDLDLVFIDADHGYQAVKDDIAVWLPKVREGGILCGHDYMKIETKHSEVRQAVDEIFTNVNLEQDILENGQIYIWWVKK